jgi:hypothetical protein
MKNPMTKCCPICCNDFVPSRINQKFCSNKCRQENFRTQREVVEQHVQSQSKNLQKLFPQFNENQPIKSAKLLSLHTQLIELQKNHGELIEQKGRGVAKIEDLQNGHTEGFICVLFSLSLFGVIAWISQWKLLRIISIPIGMAIGIVAFIIGSIIGKNRNEKSLEITNQIEYAKRNLLQLESEIAASTKNIDKIVKQIQETSPIESDKNCTEKSLS